MTMIHLVNPMESFTGGAEWRTFELYRLLSPRMEVKIWATGNPHPGWKDLFPIFPITPWLLRFPRRGTLVFVGLYFKYGSWFRLASPQRSIIIYNTPESCRLHRRTKRLSRAFQIPVEIVYAGQWMKQEAGLEGIVQASPIDLDRFKPCLTAPGNPRFTLGRLSRDVDYKHHLGDMELYRCLAAQGAAVRVMGGTCLRTQGDPPFSVTLLPEGVEPPEKFLTTLDCFFYRTDETWQEPHGRVVQEAMACGLPVVCSRGGGYSDYIRHGENGFLFDQESEALDILTELQRNVPLRYQVGCAARKTMEELFSVKALNDIVAYYLKGGAGNK